jgi:DNA-binding MarR family transcriptional regulator
VLDRTSLYRAVKPLVRRRCLRILPGRTGRERTAALTEGGRRLLEDALPIWEDVQGRFVGALGPRAWASLTSGLGQVVPTVAELREGRNFELTTAITKSAWSERLSGSVRRHADGSFPLRW